MLHACVLQHVQGKATVHAASASAHTGLDHTRLCACRGRAELTFGRVDVASLFAAACVAARERLHRVSITSPGNTLVRAFPTPAALREAARIQSLSLADDGLVDAQAVRSICQHLRNLHTLSLGINAAAADVWDALASSVVQLNWLTALDFPSPCKDSQLVAAMRPAWHWSSFAANAARVAARSSLSGLRCMAASQHSCLTLPGAGQARAWIVPMI